MKFKYIGSKKSVTWHGLEWVHGKAIEAPEGKEAALSLHPDWKEVKPRKAKKDAVTE